MFNNWNIKIISGGQTGVDRAALDFAIKNNIPCGGWCPKGRKAEDGIISDNYPLIETNSSKYTSRTERNVLESDGTLLLYLNNPDSGTILTENLCKASNKPFLHIFLKEHESFTVLRCWIENNKISTLNIAGPRESNEPGVYSATFKFLKNLFDHVKTSNC